MIKTRAEMTDTFFAPAYASAGSVRIMAKITYGPAAMLDRSIEVCADFEQVKEIVKRGASHTSRMREVIEMLQVEIAKIEARDAR